MKNVLLSLDPGKHNFAYSCLTLKGNLLFSGMLDNTINELKYPKPFTANIHMLTKEFKRIAKEIPKGAKYRVVYERFIPRSMHRGNLGEITNMAIGIMLAMSKADLYVPITAATWKNFFKKRGIVLQNKAYSVHQLDSMGIGLYYLQSQGKLSFNNLTEAVARLNSNPTGQ